MRPKTTQLAVSSSRDKQTAEVPHSFAITEIKLNGRSVAIRKIMNEFQ